MQWQSQSFYFHFNKTNWLLYLSSEFKFSQKNILQMSREIVISLNPLTLHLFMEIMSFFLKEYDVINCIQILQILKNTVFIKKLLSCPVVHGKFKSFQSTPIFIIFVYPTIKYLNAPRHANQTYLHAAVRLLST